MSVAGGRDPAEVVIVTVILYAGWPLGHMDLLFKLRLIIVSMLRPVKTNQYVYQVLLVVASDDCSLIYSSLKKLPAGLVHFRYA
jgi:hypothetical protein